MRIFAPTLSIVIVLVLVGCNPATSAGNLIEAAKQGDVNAQFDLGWKYSHGEGVTKDYQQAASWYRKAAEQGLAEAQFNLGLLYANGNGVPQNYQQSDLWYSKAAEHGIADMLNDLGDMYADGNGARKNIEQAETFYRKAAEQGDAKALFNIGMLYCCKGYYHQTYYDGGFLSNDIYQKAYIWFSLAATNGMTNSVERREFAASKLTPAELSKAQEFASSYFEMIKGAVQGQADAQYELGSMYHAGQGVAAQDYAQAVSWYRKAAEQGLADAQAYLGVMYDNGFGVAKDVKQALAWWRKAAEQGQAYAQFNLGSMYEQGRGVPKDYQQAYVWYSVSAANGEHLAIERRDKVAINLTQADLSAAQQLATSYFEQYQPKS